MKDETLIEATIEENKRDISSLKERVFNISNKTKEVAKEVSSEITMIEIEKTGALDEFRKFIDEQEKLARPYTIIEKTTHLLTNVPLVGSAFNKVYDDIKSANLDTQVVSDVAEKMHRDMQAKNELISNRLIKLYEMEENLEDMVSELKDVFLEIEQLLKETTSLEPTAKTKKEAHELKKLSVSVQKKINEMIAEQTQIRQIGIVIEDLSLTIEESLPSDKDALLRKIGTFATITTAQTHINEFLALKDMLRAIDDSSSRATINILNSILDAKDTDKEDMKRMNQRAKESQKALENIQKRIESSQQETEKTYEALTANTTKLLLQKGN